MMRIWVAFSAAALGFFLSVFHFDSLFAMPYACSSLLTQLNSSSSKSNTTDFLIWAKAEAEKKIKHLTDREKPLREYSDVKKILDAAALKENPHHIILKSFDSDYLAAAEFFSQWRDREEDYLSLPAGISDDLLSTMSPQDSIIKKAGRVGGTVALTIFFIKIAAYLAEFDFNQARGLFIGASLIQLTGFGIWLMSKILPNNDSLKQDIQKQMREEEKKAGRVERNPSQGLAMNFQSEVLSSNPPEETRFAVVNAFVPLAFNDYPPEWKKLEPKQFKILFAVGPADAELKRYRIGLALLPIK